MNKKSKKYIKYLIFVFIMCISFVHCVFAAGPEDFMHDDKEEKQIMNYYNIGNDTFLDENNFDTYYKIIIENQSIPSTPPVSELRAETIDCNGRRVFTIKCDDRYDKLIMYIHGGSFIGQLSEMQYKFAENLCKKTNSKIYIPDYPLLPNHGCLDAYDCLIRNYEIMKKEDKPIYIVGDSAGGGLALGLTKLLRDFQISVAGQVLISPWVDLEMSNPDIIKYNADLAKTSLYGLKRIGVLWAKDLALNHPVVSTINGSLIDLPKTLLFTGTKDIMQADTLLLKNKLLNAGVKVDCINKVDLFHDYPIYPITESLEALDIIAAFMK